MAEKKKSNLEGARKVPRSMAEIIDEDWPGDHETHRTLVRLANCVLCVTDHLSYQAEHSSHWARPTHGCGTPDKDTPSFEQIQNEMRYFEEHLEVLE